MALDAKDPPAYAIDALGLVHLRGGAANLNLNPLEVVANLPAAVTPRHNAEMAAPNPGYASMDEVVATTFSQSFVEAFDAKNNAVTAPTAVNFDGVTYSLS